MKNRIGSTDRAESEIGFEARVPLEEGLRALIEWRQAHQEQVADRRNKAAQPA